MNPNNKNILKASIPKKKESDKLRKLKSDIKDLKQIIKAKDAKIKELLDEVHLLSGIPTVSDSDKDLMLRLQKKLKSKSVKRKSNPFKDMTAEECSKLLGKEVE